LSCWPSFHSSCLDLPIDVAPPIRPTPCMHEPNLSL
jgi:hypothetical protein